MSHYKILLIGAHPDDPDLCGGGLAAMHLARGNEVKFLSLTDGCRGHHEMTMEQTRVRRYGETQALAAKAGLTYDVWDVPDGELFPTLELRQRLVREIRTYAPDLILTHRPCDYHPDHRNASILVQDASYLLIVPNFCPEAPALRKTPVIAYYSDRFKVPPFVPDFVTPIDEVIERKFEMIHCHTSQLYEWLPYTKGFAAEVPPEGDAARFDWLHTPRYDIELVRRAIAGESRFKNGECRFAIPAEEFRAKLVEQYGEEKAMAVRYAEAFMLSEYSGGCDRETKKALFCL